MMVNSELEAFIKQYTASKERLTESTKLVEDLHLNEQQVKTIIHDFAKKFNIDISEINFDEQNTHNFNEISVSITLGSLERAIDAGYLNDSIITDDDKDPNMPLEFTLKNSILGIIIGIIAVVLLCYVAFYV